MLGKSGLRTASSTKIGAFRARGRSIGSIQWRLMVKTRSFDGLVCTPVTGSRISIVIRICPESPLHEVFENAIKSQIRFILGS